MTAIAPPPQLRDVSITTTSARLDRTTPGTGRFALAVAGVSYE